MGNILTIYSWWVSEMWRSPRPDFLSSSSSRWISGRVPSPRQRVWKTCWRSLKQKSQFSITFGKYYPVLCTGGDRRFDRCILNWTHQCKSRLSLVHKSAFLQTVTAAGMSGPIYETFFFSGSLKLRGSCTNWSNLVESTIFDGSSRTLQRLSLY